MGPFGCTSGASWGSFPVGVFGPILVIKTTTENRPFNNNLLQKPNLRRQNDDRKNAQNLDRKTGHWIPKSVSKRFRNRPFQKVKIWPRHPPFQARFLNPSMARIPPTPTSAELIESARRKQFRHPEHLLLHILHRYGFLNLDGAIGKATPLAKSR